MSEVKIYYGTADQEQPSFADEVQIVKYSDYLALKSKLEKALEALEFYADTNNWDYEKRVSGKSKYTGNTCYDIMLFDFDRDLINRSDYAGKLARSVLAELTKEKSK